MHTTTPDDSCSPSGLPAIHETSLLHLEDLPTLVPITTSKGSARIDHTESLELSRGEQRPSNSMHPTAYVEQLRRHTAHPIETQAVRSILAASVTSSITEPSSSDSETKTGSSLQSQTVQCGVMHHPEKPDASNWGPDRPGYGNKASSAHLSTTVSLDGALSVAWTDVGSKTPAEVEALPGQHSTLPLKTTRINSNLTRMLEAYERGSGISIPIPVMINGPFTAGTC